LVYDGQPNPAAAIAAKQELSQIFTKTLTIQVWRPEFERPGRHFVYTTRYVYFFVSLLDQLDDRASLDQLLRRVRKKQGDFLNHTKLWEDICLNYAKVRQDQPLLRPSPILTNSSSSAAQQRSTKDMKKAYSNQSAGKNFPPKRLAWKA
jgi:hypothetical protein